MTATKKQPLTLHLKELSYRIKLSFFWIIIGIISAYAIKERILAFLVAPLSDALDGKPALHFSSPVEPFFTYLKLSLKAGIFLAMPAILYNVWAFVAPALYKKERKTILTVTLWGVLFFITGVLFAYFLVFPYGFKFLISFANNNSSTADVKTVLEPTIMMEPYLKLATNLMLAFGFVFELPLFIYVFAVTGAVSPAGLMKFFRYFVVIAFLASAILTPPDVVTQVMMALPLILMYLLSTLFAWITIKRREKTKQD